MENKMINVHELKLSGEGKFAERFNIVSEAFAKCKDTDYGTEEGKLLWDEYHRLKYCLEQGLGMEMAIEDHIKTLMNG